MKLENRRLGSSPILSNTVARVVPEPAEERITIKIRTKTSSDDVKEARRTYEF